MADEGLILYLGVYGDRAGAEADYRDLVALHQSGRVGTYDAAVVAKDADGRVDLPEHSKKTKHGVWSGVGIGALLGIVFPPSILGSAVVVGAAGGVVGHLRKQLSRADVDELGRALDEGQAALLVVGAPELREQTERILSRAERRIVKPLDVVHHEFAAAPRDDEAGDGATI